MIANLNTPVPRLIVISGPTATGKSGLAIALAQRLNSAIISADSRLVYQEFNIGTAKPTPAEQQLVPHHLIDVCKPTETMTVADYQSQVQALLARSSMGLFLLVGGTGLYIKAIVRGLKIPRVPPQQGLRQQLQAIGQFQNYQLLQRGDPTSAAKIHPNDQVRTLRALEVLYVTGQPLSDQQGEQPPAYPILQIGLDSSKLHCRIQLRAHQMIELGLEQEVKSLIEKYGANLPLLQTLGYAEMGAYLRGEYTLQQAIDQTVLHTRQFARRQRTWFRGVPEMEWFDGDSPDLLEQVWQQISIFLNEVKGSISPVTSGM